jgi:hypothetical protein
VVLKSSQIVSLISQLAFILISPSSHPNTELSPTPSLSCIFLLSTIFSALPPPLSPPHGQPLGLLTSHYKPNLLSYPPHFSPFLIISIPPQLSPPHCPLSPHCPTFLTALSFSLPSLLNALFSSLPSPPYCPSHCPPLLIDLLF